MQYFCLLKEAVSLQNQTLPAACARSKTFCAFFNNGMSIILPSRASISIKNNDQLEIVRL